MTVTFNTDYNFATGRDLLLPTIRDIVEQQSAESWYDDETSKFWFIGETPLTPEGKITSMVGPEALKKISEDENAPILTRMQGYEKGYELETYAGKIKITKLFKEWIRNGAQIQWADSSVKTELNKLAEDVKALIDWASLADNDEMAKVYANWFTNLEAFGAGSSSPDWLPLFSSAHKVKKNWDTFSNLATGALTSTTLAAAIAKHKTELRMGNGRRVKSAASYDLIVTRAGEENARIILNSNSNQAGPYAWTGTNANLLNEFSFDWFRVNLIISDVLGQTDADGNVIGNDTMWFVRNTPLANYLKAFRKFTLWGLETKMYENDETDATYVKVSCHKGYDHYNPECIVGSLWT